MSPTSACFRQQQCRFTSPCQGVLQASTTTARGQNKGCQCTARRQRTGSRSSATALPGVPAAALAAAAAATTAGGPRACRAHEAQLRPRSFVRTHAWFKQQPARTLWDYDGSCVKQLTLAEVQLLHRLSFGHRNQRSYLIVLYQADSPACQAFEAEVERLASGLRHEPAFVAGALEVSGQEAAGFASTMLGVSNVPAVLLYPEATRGCLKFLGPDLSATGMLAAINRARAKGMPATADSPGASWWQLLDAATPLAVTSFKAAAASGSTQAMVASLQQQMQPLQPTPLVAQQAPNVWSQGRAQFWAAVLLASFAFLAWDLKLSDMWEDWCLARRQAARARGQRMTASENLDDVVTLLMLKLTGGLQQEGQEASAQQQQASSRSKIGPQNAGQQQSPLTQPPPPEQQQQQQQQQGQEHLSGELVLEKKGQGWEMSEGTK